MMEGKQIVKQDVGVQKKEIMKEKVGENQCELDSAQEAERCERYRKIRRSNTINNQGRISATDK